MNVVIVTIFFSQKCHLAQHKIIHTGERPCECSNCEKCFVSISHLVIPENHTLEKNLIIAPFVMNDLRDSYI